METTIQSNENQFVQMIKKLLLSISLVALLSCSKPPVFSSEESALITAADARTPFRVLQITDRQDSAVLRTLCRDVENFAGDATLALFIERLKTTLIASEGVGIAAPQVGVAKNIFLFMRLDLPDTPVITVINPTIVSRSDTTVCFVRDGCLSIPDFRGNSVRYPWVEVEYFDEQGKLIRERLEGFRREDTFTAVIFQHEYDHTRGVLFIDKLCE
jgi:peptide deformylase